ncbi:phage tail protein I [Salipiger sp. IMCC34102]|uniref:phage tail protein I n=1 Tax=Salipiger sp. IMCC34102 TaxID=2510647 RepID=UPI0013ECC042|nr:phage tail protein I [Salipiger sp. IMCC34102]
MSDPRSLLPSGATEAERALEGAVSRIGLVALPEAMNSRAETAAPDHLPFLAWAFSADTWDPSWPEAVKRQVVSGAVEVHRRKGTLGALRRALADMGYGAAVIREYRDRPRYGNGATYGTIGSAEQWESWADYRIELGETVSRADVAAVFARAQRIAPVRCRLVSVNFRRVALQYGDDLVAGTGQAYGDTITQEVAA